MHRPTLSSLSRRHRLGVATSLVFGLLGVFMVVAPNAFAHHPTVAATTTCNTAGGGYQVDFTSASWQQSGGATGGGTNSHIDIYYRFGSNGSASTPWTMLPWQAGYQYSPANGYQFADSFPVADLANGDQVQLQARATGNWGNGNAGGQTTDSSWESFPSDCEIPGTAEVDASASCASGQGAIVITLQNTGAANAAPVSFSVTNPNDGTVTLRQVAAGASDTVTLSPFADGAITIPVTADGVHHDQSVTVKCSVPGTPAVSSSISCSSGDGDIIIVLANTGGNQPITFVVTDPRTGIETIRVVNPGGSDSVTLTGHPDGSVTIGVTANGQAHDQAVTVACDMPGTPSVKIAMTCTNAQGEITVQLRNTDGDLPVTFVVTDPRTGGSITKTVPVGGHDAVVLSGVDDGTITIPVTADGVAVNQSVTVHCDMPGTPSVSAGATCVQVEGVITVTLANTGGNQPVTFVVTDSRDNTTTTKVVGVGASDSVELTGFADGTITIPVSADGQSMAQTVSVKCHRPGVPHAVAAPSCANFDGDVVVTLTNTGGTDAVHFVVTDPRGGTPVVKNVAVGGSATVTFTGFADGQLTIGVTADGKALSGPVTIDCDRPGTPSVAHDLVCAAHGGDVIVTVKNASLPGEAEPIDFVVTDPRDGAHSAVRLAAGVTYTVTLEHLADGSYVIPVFADGVKLPAIHVTVDCQDPHLVSIVTSCDEGGVIVTVSNTGGSPVDVSVLQDTLSVATVTVPAGGTNSVLVPMASDQTSVIAVLDGATEVQTQTVTYTCEQTADTTLVRDPGTTVPGSPTTSEPHDPQMQVRGVSVTVPPTTGTLPVTGSSSLGYVLLAGALLLGGLSLLHAARKVA